MNPSKPGKHVTRRSSSDDPRSQVSLSHSQKNSSLDQRSNARYQANVAQQQAQLQFGGEVALVGATIRRNIRLGQESKKGLEVNDQTSFVRHKALEAFDGNASRKTKVQGVTGHQLQDKLPLPQIMSSDPRQRSNSVRIGQEGDSLVFSRRKTSGDMVHFSTDGGAQSIKTNDIMYPSLADSKTAAHFGPGVYFTDRSIIQSESDQRQETMVSQDNHACHSLSRKKQIDLLKKKGANALPPTRIDGPLTHEAIQEALYTQANETNAGRSAQVLETTPDVFRNHTVNTYEIMPSKIEEMRAEVNRRKAPGRAIAEQRENAAMLQEKNTLRLEAKATGIAKSKKATPESIQEAKRLATEARLSANQLHQLAKTSRLNAETRYNRVGISQEWHAGDDPGKRRTVHKIETNKPVHVDLGAAKKTGQWTLSQPKRVPQKPVRKIRESPF